MVVVYTNQSGSLNLSKKNPDFPAGVDASTTSASLSLVIVGARALHTSSMFGMKAASSTRTALADQPLRALGLPEGSDIILEPVENLS